MVRTPGYYVRYIRFNEKEKTWKSCIRFFYLRKNAVKFLQDKSYTFVENYYIPGY